MAESLEWAHYWPTVGLRGSTKLPLSAWRSILDDPTSQIVVRKLSLMLSVTTPYTPGLGNSFVGPIGGFSTSPGGTTRMQRLPTASQADRIL